MTKICPRCGSSQLKLTDVKKTPDPLLGPTPKEAHYTIRLHCPDCKKAMTVTGQLLVTVRDVNN